MPVVTGGEDMSKYRRQLRTLRAELKKKNEEYRLAYPRGEADRGGPRPGPAGGAASLLPGRRELGRGGRADRAWERGELAETGKSFCRGKFLKMSEMSEMSVFKML